jgi:hypothetical protein
VFVERKPRLWAFVLRVRRKGEEATKVAEQTASSSLPLPSCIIIMCRCLKQNKKDSTKALTLVLLLQGFFGKKMAVYVGAFSRN